MLEFETFLIVLLIANVIWFGAAFRLFWLKARAAAKLLVSKKDRDSPLYQTLIAALPFLGGMNLSLSLFSLLILVFFDDFRATVHIVVYCSVFAVAHASQFAGNVPIAITEHKSGESLWPVLRGPMFFIFVVDLVMALLNATFAAIALVSWPGA